MDTTYSLKLPPKNYRRIIEELSVVIPDPALKLKFLKQAINEHQKISAPYKLYPPIAGIAFRKKLLNNAEQIWPGSKKAVKKLICTGVVSAPHSKLLWLYKLRYAIGSAILMFFILGVGTAISPLVGSFNLDALIKLNSQQVKITNAKVIIRKPVFHSQRSGSGDNPNSYRVIIKPVNHKNRSVQIPDYLRNPVLMALASQQIISPKPDRISQKTLLSAQLRNRGNHPATAIAKPAIFQTRPEQILKYLQNPILTALTSQQIINSKSDPITPKPPLSFQTSESENHSPSLVVKPVNHQRRSARVAKYLQNPVLMALTSQQVKNSKPVRISQKTLLSAQPRNRAKHPPAATIEPAKNQNKPELVLKYFQNPILMALASQQIINSTSDRISQKTLLSAQSRNRGNHPTLAIIKPAKHQNESKLVLRYFQNPILMALASQQIINSTSDPITQKTLLSSQTPESESHSPPTVVKPANHQHGPARVLKYLQNPVLIALISQRIKNSTRDRTIEKTMLSSRPHESEDQPPSSIIKPLNHQNRSGQVAEYLQNPILSALTFQRIISSKPDRIAQKPLLSSQTLESESHSPSPVVKTAKYQNESEPVPEYLRKPIWLVEKTSDREIYSNRLQIITTYTISNIPREYYRFPKNSKKLPANSKTTNKIAGIVYHASESDLYPFMPEMNRSIQKYSKRLIKYLLRKKSYNFFIDRFGRVYRLVQEDQVAFHAGNSIWADDEEVYLNLNHAFIGICFEGKDFEEIKIGDQKKGQLKNSKSSLLKPTGILSVNEAQLRSGKELTDWLRVKYNIPQHNCVPHALISVNPNRMLIGYHLDLARGFPFAKFGLSDKYQEFLPSMVEFGFLYDRYFEKIFNGELWRGIRSSEQILQRQAANSGMSFAEYRKSLQRKFSRYREWNKKMLEKKDPTDINPPQGPLTAAQN